jgi:hypothetical protein
MKSEKLTVPEYFWARFKGKDKVGGALPLLSGMRGARGTDS